MEKGRLVRIVKPFGQASAVGYIVALSDPARATARVREQAAAPEDKVEDVCGVSAALIQWLNLSPGDFVCWSRKPPRRVKGSSVTASGPASLASSLDASDN
jgi:hypothetical protein